MGQRAIQRAWLIREMERLYADRAWRDSELAERLEVNRTTIYRTRRFMEEELSTPFLEDPPGHYRIDRQRQLGSIRLTPTEALALYLGGRRLQQQTRVGHLPTASALEKLAQVLRRPMMEGLVRAAQEVLEQENDPRVANVLEQIVEGWITNRKVRVRYRRPHADDARVHTFSPYQLEPSVWSDGVYLIGHSDHYDAVIPLKLSRIEHATVTTEPFTIPADFDSHTLLQHAWGIWRADDRDPCTVRLRFSRRVTPRVKETVWHPSQTVRDCDGGGCVWEAQIAEWREMEPWVRGWGADVEVLAPADLRDSVIASLRQAAAQYGLLS
jgi:CRISPR-associated endonuclease/helicase Cas3